MDERSAFVLHPCCILTASLKMQLRWHVLLQHLIPLSAPVNYSPGTRKMHVIKQGRK